MSHQSGRYSAYADEALMRACAADGDEDAFRELYRRHAEAVVRFLRLRTAVDDVDDVLIETFSAAWVGRAAFRLEPGANALPWLLGIAARQAARYRAQEQRWRRSESAEATASRSVDHHEPAIGFDPALLRAIHDLSDREREILLLVSVGDMPVAMAARALGISAVAARVRLHRARRNVEKSLGQEGDRS